MCLSVDLNIMLKEGNTHPCELFICFCQTDYLADMQKPDSVCWLCATDLGSAETVEVPAQSGTFLLPNARQFAGFHVMIHGDLWSA